MKRKYELIIHQSNRIDKIECGEQETILEAMLRQGISYRSDCGGRGSCGKCKVWVLSGSLKVTAQDKVLFREQELGEGLRLACKAIPEEDVTIRLGSFSEQGMKGITQSVHSITGIDELQGKTAFRAAGNEDPVDPSSGIDKVNSVDCSLGIDKVNPVDCSLGIDKVNSVDCSLGIDKVKSVDPSSGIDKVNSSDYSSDNDKVNSGGCILGIDLGSTTLAFQLVDIRQGRSLASHSMINPQRAYGADVVSRIKAANDGKADQLMRMIRTALEEGMKAVLQIAQLSMEQIGQITIAGNTTMIHLLMGYSCQRLGVYPFTPVTLDRISINSKEIFPGLKPGNIPLTLLPGISAFVGGDILAGLLACGYPNTEEISLLIDFGTNGELALGNKDKLLVTSTAAGPAFEGGNLSCGIGGISGAINHVSIKADKISYDTIDQQPAIGICGSGAIELLAELYRNGIIDETGLLQVEYFDRGFPLLNSIVLTQKDIRELQMAKAAIRAGIEILLKRYGISYHQVDKVYLAGGFGFYLDISKAICIGLLPEAFQDKILSVGNSSLAGAVMYGRDQDVIPQMKRIIASSQELHLSNDEDFQELYLKYMYFGNPDME